MIQKGSADLEDHIHESHPALEPTWHQQGRLRPEDMGMCRAVAPKVCRRKTRGHPAQVQEPNHAAALLGATAVAKAAESLARRLDDAEQVGGCLATLVTVYSTVTS